MIPFRMHFVAKPILIGLVAALAAVLIALPAAGQMSLPSDVDPTCTVSQTDFDGWFMSGTASAGGAVKGASSSTFPTDNTVCDFYKWGAQMFLWLTSPTSDGLTLDSPAIFNVTPADSTGVRHLQANTASTVPSFALRAEKFDEVGEVGQAGSGGVLVSQQNALVYYGVHINDAYGYFLTGQKGGSLTQTEFPHNASDMTALTTYLSTSFPGTNLVAPQTLVMELKTSWVDASTVPSTDSFVTMEATVPTFTKNASNSKWTASGTETITLALVGLHVVGTVKNHPEFVWITFEHIANAPDAAYYYTNKKKDVVKQPFSSSGTYLFMAINGAESSANVECAKISGGNGTIVAAPKSKKDPSPACVGGIVASNTARSYPWGSVADSQDATVVSNNTDLLSINQSVRGFLAALSGKDVRANYIQTGGIWTSASGTSDAPIPKTTGYSASDLRGSLQAFNATLETYTQGSSCFGCHYQSSTSPNSFQPFELSHIYSQIAPLTPPNN